MRHEAWLHGKLREWVTEGVLDDATAEKIAAHVPIPPRRFRLQTILAILGALILATGVILVVAANWDMIPKVVRVGVVLFVLGGAYYGAWRLRYSPGEHPDLGEAMLLLGGLLFGAGIWLIAQIFHMNDHTPNGVLLWGLGVLPLAWGTRSHALTILSLACLGLWTGMEVPHAVDTFRPWLLLPVVPAVALAYRIQGRAAVAVALLVALESLAFAIGVILEERALMLLPALGVATYLGGLVHESIGGKAARHGPAFRFIGSAGAILGMFLLTFEPVVEEALEESGGGLLTGVSAVLVLGCLALAAWRSLTEKSVASRTAMGVMVALLLYMVGSAHAPDGSEVGLAAINNIILLVLLSGGIAFASHRGDRPLMALSIVGVTGLVVARYFDVFFDLLPRGITFIIVGGALLGGAIATVKYRHRLMKATGTEEAS